MATTILYIVLETYRLIEILTACVTYLATPIVAAVSLFEGPYHLALRYANLLHAPWCVQAWKFSGCDMRLAEDHNGLSIYQVCGTDEWISFLRFEHIPMRLLWTFFNAARGTVSLATNYGFSLILLLVVVSFMKGWLRTSWRQDLRTRILSAYQRKPTVSPGRMSDAFHTTPGHLDRLSVVQPQGNVTNDKVAAANFVDTLALILGKRAFFLDRSSYDELSGREGSKAMNVVLDGVCSPAPLNVPSSSIVAHIGNDHSSDMPRVLSDHYQPHVVYALQPDSVAKTGSEYNYYFNDAGEIEVFQCGGRFRKHRVWNYSTDHLKITRRFMGFPYKCTAYQVDRVPVKADHQMILLSPVGQWFGLAAWLYASTIWGKELEHIDTVHGEHTRLVTIGVKGAQISTGRVGSFNAVTVPCEFDEAIKTAVRCGKHDLISPQVQTFIDGKDAKYVKAATAALFDYHFSKQKKKASIVYPVDQCVRRYQFDPINYDPAATNSLIPFMPAIINGAFKGDNTRGNTVRAVVGRVEAIRPDKIQPSQFLFTCMSEFVDMLVPTAGICDPVGNDELMVQQATSRQRRILQAAEWVLPKPLAKIFKKVEAHQKVADDRIITTMDGPTKRDYSLYMYGFGEVMKRHAWYAFGKGPVKIAARVAQICTDALDMVCNSDFSRFDGHGSNVMRALERAVLLRAFKPCYHEEISRLHAAQYGMDAVSSDDVWYKVAFARASGSPETSVFNSIVNAFVAYYALRKIQESQGRHDPIKAWSGLGIYGGDDGLTADVDCKKYAEAAVEMGQVLTCEPVLRGNIGVKFLARVYAPQVWTGCKDSCCDVDRQMKKFHTSSNLPDSVTSTEKLLEKCRGFGLSDANTPIIGTLCRKVVALHGKDIEESKKTVEMRSWLSRAIGDGQYPNEPGAWMLDYVASQLPDFEFDRYDDWLTKCKSLEELVSTAPACLEAPEAKSSVPVIVDKELVSPDPVINALPDRPETKTETKVCVGNDAEPVFAPEGLVMSKRLMEEDLDAMVLEIKSRGWKTREEKPCTPPAAKVAVEPATQHASSAGVAPAVRADVMVPVVEVKNKPDLKALKQALFQAKKALGVAEGTWEERPSKPHNQKGKKPSAPGGGAVARKGKPPGGAAKPG